MAMAPLLWQTVELQLLRCLGRTVALQLLQYLGRTAAHLLLRCPGSSSTRPSLTRRGPGRVERQTCSVLSNALFGCSALFLRQAWWCARSGPVRFGVISS